jgi:hypothetical protein
VIVLLNVVYPVCVWLGVCPEVPDPVGVFEEVDVPVLEPVTVGVFVVLAVWVCDPVWV